MRAPDKKSFVLPLKNLELALLVFLKHLRMIIPINRKSTQIVKIHKDFSFFLLFLFILLILLLYPLPTIR